MFRNISGEIRIEEPLGAALSNDSIKWSGSGEIVNIKIVTETTNQPNKLPSFALRPQRQHAIRNITNTKPFPIEKIINIGPVSNK